VVVTTASEFRTAVREYRFDSFALDGDAIDAARASVAEAGLIVVGEPHGTYETPAVVYSLAVALGTRAVAFEWSHEEMDEPVQDFVRTGSFDYERLWSLPPSAEFFCGDGRITTGHFALLQRLRAESRLEQVIAFDRLDPVPHPEDWRIRDREMAERLLAEWQGSAPLLVMTGAFHAAMQPYLDPEGETMTALLARERTGLVPAMLQYDNSVPMPSAPITFRLPKGTASVVPGVQSSGRTGT
jgi:erythromycin esterase-like protein